MRQLLSFSLIFLGLLQAFLVAAFPEGDLLSKIERVKNSAELRNLEGLSDFVTEEQVFSAQEVSHLLEALQADRLTHATKHRHSPLDQLINAFRFMAHDPERKNAFMELFPQIRFQWVRTRDWEFLSTITINPKPHDLRKPAVLVRTPYGPTTSNLADIYLLDGFVAVLQDQRGAFLSTGQWDFWRQDSQDAYDTMEWISKQFWSNGRVYSAGISADGCSALTQPLFRPPWLAGQFIVWATAEAHDTSYQGGAHRQGLLNKWLTAIGITTRLHSWTVIDDVIEHERKDEYWDTLSLRDNNAYANVSFPAVFWTGWYDIFQGQNIEAFNSYQTLSTASGKSILYVDPGGHCVGSGGANFPNSFTLLPIMLSREMFKAIEAGSFLNTTEKIIMYVMGTAFKHSQVDTDVGNYWTTLPTWPKQTPTPFYLDLNGRMTTALPTQSGASASYLFNPKNPIDTPGGNNLAHPCGVHDLTHLEGREDVLVFTSDPLKEPLALVGRLQVVLYVSSNAVDTDFVAFLTDVSPNNSSALVQDGIIRMRWREDKVNPVQMVEGNVYRVTLDLWYIAQVFNQNHRIRVLISSSNTPRFSVNRNNGMLVGEEGPYVEAINTVHFSPDHPSHLLLPVVRLEDIPENPSIKERYVVEPQNF